MSEVTALPTAPPSTTALMFFNYFDRQGRKERKKERKKEGFELLFINLSCYFSYFLLLAAVPRHTAPRSSKMLSYKFNLFSPFKKIRSKLTRNVFQKLAILSLCFCLFLVYSINNIISQQLNVKTSYIQTHKVSI